jgi:hypothetical protein
MSMTRKAQANDAQKQALPEYRVASPMPAAVI